MQTEARLGIIEAVLEERHRYYLTMFAAQSAAVRASIEAASTAVAKAEGATDKRFESVNEFRASLTDMTARLMPRSEADQQATALGSRIDALKEAMGVLQNQLASLQAKGQGMQAGWTYLLGAIAAAGALFGVIAFFKAGGP